MCAVLMLSQMSSSQRRSQICHLWSLHSLSVVRQSVSHLQLDRTCAVRDGEAGQIYVIWQILWCDKPGLCWWFWNGSTTWRTRGLKKWELCILKITAREKHSQICLILKPGCLVVTAFALQKDKIPLPVQKSSIGLRASLPAMPSQYSDKQVIVTLMQVRCV